MNADTKEVIRLVNEARSVLGLSPLSHLPRGMKRDCLACPLARALRTPVDYDYAYFPQEDEDYANWVAETWGTGYLRHMKDPEGEPSIAVTLPDVLATFVWAFDDGKYPELELG